DHPRRIDPPNCPGCLLSLLRCSPGWNWPYPELGAGAIRPHRPAWTNKLADTRYLPTAIHPWVLNPALFPNTVPELPWTPQDDVDCCKACPVRKGNLRHLPTVGPKPGIYRAFA